MNNIPVKVLIDMLLLLYDNLNTIILHCSLYLFRSHTLYGDNEKLFMCLCINHTAKLLIIKCILLVILLLLAVAMHVDTYMLPLNCCY